MEWIKVKKNTNIRSECSFCFDNESEILQIKGKGFITISLCKRCLEQINKQAKN